MKLDKIARILAPRHIDEINKMSDDDLRRTVVAGEEAIKTATEERDENPKYQAAKQAVSDLSAGLKEVKKYQGAKIHYALELLRDRSVSIPVELTPQDLEDTAE